MNQKIQWTEQDWKLEDLQDYKNNPRTMGKSDFERLVESIKQDGYHQRLLINRDGTIIGGHSRKKALLKAGFKKTEKVPVLVPDRLLDATELDRINIKDNLPFGAWDFDILGNRFDIGQLSEWGMPKNLLDGIKVPDFSAAGENEQGKLDELTEEIVQCPHCNNKFNLNESKPKN